ncbi:helix-turn-helix domain-containing protein [Rhodococcoides fascians]|uniref:helix-turn-helix domain-containing protein n=1 Tax=Rhodococcoides fascians TaxID=1828 RepID=UPI00068D1586|nr:helix-turn-helix transcriptional regulator [Rhodococcus fascians]
MSAPSAPRLQIPVFDLADRLRKSLRVSGMSVQEMGDYLEITRETVGRYMNGHVRVPGPTLRVWAMVTGVPFEWLKDGTVPAELAAETQGAESNPRTLD